MQGHVLVIILAMNLFLSGMVRQMISGKWLGR